MKTVQTQENYPQCSALPQLTKTNGPHVLAWHIKIEGTSLREPGCRISSTAGESQAGTQIISLHSERFWKAVLTAVKQKPETLQSFGDGILHQPRMKAAAAWRRELESNTKKEREEEGMLGKCLMTLGSLVIRLSRVKYEFINFQPMKAESEWNQRDEDNEKNNRQNLSFSPSEVTSKGKHNRHTDGWSTQL